MRYMTVGIAGLGLLAAACSQQASGEKPASAQVTASLGSVALDKPLRALGTEPFWHVDITDAALTYKDMEEKTLTTGHKGAQVTGNVAVWEGEAESPKMVVTATATDCSDGMSDRIYPLSVKVEIDGRSLVGCAASLEALESAGESGRVE